MNELLYRPKEGAPANAVGDFARSANPRWGGARGKAPHKKERARRLLHEITLAVALFGGAAAAPRHAMASDAESLFREGRKAVQAGDYATACTKFAESERLEPAPGTLLGLADCEDHLGRFVRASEHYRLAASGFQRTDPRRKFAMDRASALDARVAHLTLKLSPSAPSGTVVKRDGQVLPPSIFDREEAADPGDVQLVVVAPGRVERSYRVHLDESKAVTLVVDAGEVAPIAKSPVAPTKVGLPSDKSVESASRSRKTKRTLGFILGGVGVTSLAVGGVTGIIALDKAGTVRDHCDENVRCDQEGLDAAKAGDIFAPLSTITLAAGVILIGAGVYFLLTAGSDAKGSSSSAHSTAGFTRMHSAFGPIVPIPSGFAF